MLYTKLWFILRDTFWGKNIGRARQALVKSIFSLAILGGTAIWAQPKIYKWLVPPEPIALGTCSDRMISVGSTPLTGDLVKAKQIIGQPDITIKNAAWIWNNQKDRLEFWLVTEEDMWQLELTCFEIVTPGQNYGAQFGEFRVDNITDLQDWDSKLKAIETGE